MPDERYVVMTVECQHCATMQKVHVADRTGVGQMGNQTIWCINCEKEFDVMVPEGWRLTTRNVEASGAPKIT
jgi:transcription elongation factor Elf1